jgi:hypothetical protein
LAGSSPSRGGKREYFRRPLSRIATDQRQREERIRELREQMAAMDQPPHAA